MDRYHAAKAVGTGRFGNAQSGVGIVGLADRMFDRVDPARMRDQQDLRTHMGERIAPAPSRAAQAARADGMRQSDRIPCQRRDARVEIVGEARQGQRGCGGRTELRHDPGNTGRQPVLILNRIERCGELAKILRPVALRQHDAMR